MRFIYIGQKHGKVNKKSGMPFHSDTTFTYSMGSRLIPIPKVTLRPPSPQMGLMWYMAITKKLPHWYHGDTFDVDPKVGGGFELKTTSFRNLL
jgi:hypothetical protein